LPGIIGSTSPFLAILEPIISDPASPNPKAKRDPIFIMAFSIITVSYWSSPPSSLISSYSLAEIGFLAILFTLLIILSMGPKARSLASFVKARAPKVRTIQTNIVLPNDKPAITILEDLILREPYICISSSSGDVIIIDSR
jgi:hypothetical protein